MSQFEKDSLVRFSDRVSDYVKYRPSYPREVIEFLASGLGLRPEHKVADIGSGTGIFTKLLLENGNTVYAVEPNREMREAAEQMLRGNPGFISVGARAEDTQLKDRSIDLVTAAQAFHWFDAEKCRREFARILQAEGRIALIWNERETDTTPFLRAYEAMLQTHGTDYCEVKHATGAEESFHRLFGQGGYGIFECPNHQSFDYEGLRGRLLSSSYAPPAGHPRHEPMIRELKRIFEEFQENGQVSFDYTTRIYHGRPGG